FEPCGLAQMISMRYGTIPIVHATGGLADTVRDFKTREYTGNGIVFKELDAEHLCKAVQRGVEIFKTRFTNSAWKTLQQNAFQSDVSWNHSAQQYKKLYSELLENE